MEGFGDRQVGVGAHADFLGHHERGHLRLVGLPGQRDHVEQRVEVIAELVGHALRRIGQVHLRALAGGQALHALLHLAHRVEVVADARAVGRADALLQRGAFARSRSRAGCRSR